MTSKAGRSLVDLWYLKVMPLQIKNPPPTKTPQPYELNQEKCIPVPLSQWIVKMNKGPFHITAQTNKLLIMNWTEVHQPIGTMNSHSQKLTKGFPS